MINAMENAVVSCLFYPSLEFLVINLKNWGKNPISAVRVNVYECCYAPGLDGIT